MVYAWQWLYLRGLFPGLQKKAIIFMLHRMSIPDTPYSNGHSAEFVDHGTFHGSRAIHRCAVSRFSLKRVGPMAFSGFLVLWKRI